MNTTLATLAAKANAFGYTVIATIEHNKSRKMVYNNIYLQKDFNRRFQPELYYDGYNYVTEKHAFKLQTTSYGALAGEELGIYMQELTKAFSFMKFLEKFDVEEALRKASANIAAGVDPKSILSEPNKLHFSIDEEDY